MKSFILLMYFSISLSSCYHYYYAPNTANAPLLSQKGESRFNLLYTSGNSSGIKGCELQLAHAISKNAGIMINGFSAGREEEVAYDNSGSDYHTEDGSGSYIELAGGLFKNFDAKKKWIGEVYGGAGYGSVKNSYGNSDYSTVRTVKFFLQPAFGYKARNFEMALIPKLSVLNWKVKESRIMFSQNSDINGELNYIRNNPGNLIFEPALLLRGGANDLKVQAGLSYSSFNTAGIPDRSGISEKLTISLGISINIKPQTKNKP